MDLPPLPPGVLTKPGVLLVNDLETKILPQLERRVLASPLTCLL